MNTRLADSLFKQSKAIDVVLSDAQTDEIKTLCGYLAEYQSETDSAELIGEINLRVDSLINPHSKQQ